MRRGLGKIQAGRAPFGDFEILGAGSHPEQSRSSIFILALRPPEGPRFSQRAEGSPIPQASAGYVQAFRFNGSGDPSLRLNYGFARDDAARLRKFQAGSVNINARNE
jgi:hypothetical protein